MHTTFRWLLSGKIQGHTFGTGSILIAEPVGESQISGKIIRMSFPIDRLVRTRRKTIAIVVERDGKLTVRAPLCIADVHIHEFVDAHSDWIIKNQAKARLSAPPPPKQFTEGETFLYLGKSYPLTILPHQGSALTFNHSSFRLALSALPKAEQVFVCWYKKQALEVFTERVELLARRYGFTYQKVRISSARTRWGSCSSRGTLSFSWRLVLTPLEVADYVVLHELVHIRIKNHSKTFWARVGEILPEYKTHVRWLKKNGRSLM